MCSPGTPRENIAYPRPGPATETLAGAVDALGLHPLIDRIGGCHAMVEPSTLSAGESRLVALASAYVCPAPIAILDEATSHLDPGHEALVERAIAARPGTLIVIAHRISSAIRARRVLLLEGSHAVIGTHDELLTRSPLYAELVGLWDLHAVHSRAVSSRNGAEERYRGWSTTRSARRTRSLDVVRLPYVMFLRCLHRQESVFGRRGTWSIAVLLASTRLVITLRGPNFILDQLADGRGSPDGGSAYRRLEEAVRAG